MSRPYCPKQGDVVWLSFTPQAGHEQAGHRPALALSPEAYNRKVGLAIFCPITSQAKGYPFEVSIPAGLSIAGVILSDQVKSLDWHARGAQFCCKIPGATLAEVLSKLNVLLGDCV
ncbi:MAG: endoribonuclease MazF [Elusimicrobia bacterium]|nr:endoribonuclease MazF [Elusimicrobiota bacterium]